MEGEGGGAALGVGEPQVEGRAAAGARGGCYFAAVGLDDDAAEGQSEAGACGFSCHEGLEDAVDDLRVEAGAVVFDFEEGALVAAEGARHDRAAGAALQRFDGVQVEVGEDALEEDGVTADVEITRDDGDLEGDIGGEDEGVSGGFDEAREREGLAAHGLAAGEAEDAADDVVGAADLGAYLIEVALEAGAIVDVALREEERGLGDGEGVSELVRDAGPHGAGGGEASGATFVFFGGELGHGAAMCSAARACGAQKTRGPGGGTSSPSAAAGACAALGGCTDLAQVK